MKVRTRLPGRKVDDVAYRGEECGEEVMRAVRSYVGNWVMTE